MSLFEKAISGGKWTTIESAFKAIIQLLRLYILTKLLLPSDYGLMAMAMVIIGFSGMFADFGLSAAIIYKKDATKKELSTLYWFNVLAGIIICLIIFFSSDIIASYFNQNNLAAILQLFAFLFIIDSLASQYNALLRKHLMFVELAKINIFSLTISFLITVALAYYYKKGVYSLVYGHIVFSVLSSFLKIFIGRKFHKPQFYYNLSEIKYYLSFGGYQFGERMVSYIRKEGDSLIIASILNVEVLGMYKVAKILVQKPIMLVEGIFGKMAFPIFSTIEDKQQLRRWSTNIFQLVMGIILPISGVLIVFPEVIVTYFYGDDWFGLVPFIRVLAILFSLRILRTTFGPLLISRGKAKAAFQYNLVFSIVTIVVMIISINYSIIYLLYGLIGVEICFMQPLNYVYIIKPILDLTVKKYLVLMMTAVIPSFGFIFITFYLYSTFSESSNLGFNLLIFGVGCLVYLVLFYWLSRETIKFAQMKLFTKKYPLNQTSNFD